MAQILLNIFRSGSANMQQDPPNIEKLSTIRTKKRKFATPTTTNNGTITIHPVVRDNPLSANKWFCRPK